MSMSPALHPRSPDTRAWQLQVWISFGIAVLLCGTGLAWLPVAPIERAFMVMAYVFCLCSVFALAKFIRDRHAGLPETPAWGEGRVCPAPEAAPRLSGMSGQGASRRPGCFPGQGLQRRPAPGKSMARRVCEITGLLGRWRARLSGSQPDLRAPPMSRPVLSQTRLSGAGQTLP
jgi:hypothetical protein